MKIYDENGNLLSENPDLSKGWLSEELRLLLHHPEKPEVQEQSHDELMEGTDGLYRRVIDVPYHPAVPAWNEYETVQVYRLYTPEQLAEAQKPTLEQRLTAAENALLELMLGGAVNG